MDAKDSENWTPLQFAAEEGHPAVAEVLLLAGGAAADTKTKDGFTPLHLAAREGLSLGKSIQTARAVHWLLIRRQLGAAGSPALNVIYV